MFGAHGEPLSGVGALSSVEVRYDVDEQRTRHQHLLDLAARHADHAHSLRRLADRVDEGTLPLTRALEPVLALHTTSTWTGRAADQSRDRLDTHALRAQHTAAAAQVLAAELRTEAAGEAMQSSLARWEAEGLFRIIAELEIDAGLFDHL